MLAVQFFLTGKCAVLRVCVCVDTSFLIVDIAEIVCESQCCRHAIAMRYGRPGCGRCARHCLDSEESGRQESRLEVHSGVLRLAADAVLI